MIEWADVAKVSAGALLSIGGWTIKDYMKHRITDASQPKPKTPQQCILEHQQLVSGLESELRPMRRAMIQILLMMHPICDELLKNSAGGRYKDVDCDAFHRSIAELSE